MGQSEKPKKENILDLGKYLNKEIRVKFNGGREGSCFSSFFLWFLSFLILDVWAFILGRGGGGRGKGEGSCGVSLLFSGRKRGERG